MCVCAVTGEGSSQIYGAWIELALNIVLCATVYECMKPTPSEETDVGTQAVLNFPSFEGTPRFSTTFARARQFSLSRAR